MNNVAVDQKNKTLFIVGAGAGYDYNMPTGEDLLTEIASLLERSNSFKGNFGFGNQGVFDNALQNIFNVRGKDYQALHSAVVRIHRGLVFSRSIDTLLTDSDDEDMNCAGKIAISMVLSAREKKAAFFRFVSQEVRPISPKSRELVHGTQITIRDTWMPSFFRELRAGLTRKQFKTLLSQTTVITFNYDRLLEHFLDVAIHQYDGIPLVEAAALRRRLRIIHPYGVLAPVFEHDAVLDVQNKTVRLDRHDQSSIAKAPSLIKTYDETIASDLDDDIKTLVQTTPRIIFLGFGYHPQNMRLLGFPRPPFHKYSGKFYGTAMGLSSARQERLKDNTCKLHKGQPEPAGKWHFEDATCKELIDEHGDAFYPDP
jgi:hypothetical protein